MFFKIPTIISYISQTIPLNAGDIIATGSPEGTGANQVPPNFLKKFDTVQISVSTVGTLTNNVG
jgi:2-keto-4-pentenoate hydratase/2-oxohepta-3-ene-1,7-dioic acid hydratase in catechol pathway